MKIKIIDLLNKIANGEEPPKKIMFGADIYNYVEELQDYKHEKLNDWIFEDYIISHILNIEVEILETTLNTNNMNITGSKKIEKVDEPYESCIFSTDYDNATILEQKIIDNIEFIRKKQDEIINYINKE